jgi:hypothetical protein
MSLTDGDEITSRLPNPNSRPPSARPFLFSMTRHPDWSTRLSKFLVDRDQVPFAWQANDCATFSCDAIQAITGVDLAAVYRGTYKTQRGSLRAIRKVCGGSSVEDAAVHAATQHNLPEINPRMAGRGDWVLLPNGEQRMLGIVALDGKHAVAVADQGLIFVPLTRALRAWKI